MNITKFIKDKGNKYKVIIDNGEYILYDDAILKYSLLSKKYIDNELFEEVIKYNDSLKYYYLVLKFINKRLRCKKEIIDYLAKKEANKDIIDFIINKLSNEGYLNEYVYLKSFINDSLNLSDDGPLKIKAKLIKLGFDDNSINEVLDDILSNTDMNKRIGNLIDKRVRLNNNKGKYYLKRKILLDLTNLGYNKETILDLLNNVNFGDSNIYKKEREKAINKYSKKYSGYELDSKVNNYLYRKGFSVGEYYEE
jgi:regulatory protein